MYIFLVQSNRILESGFERFDLTRIRVCVCVCFFGVCVCVCVCVCVFEEGGRVILSPLPVGFPLITQKR